MDMFGKGTTSVVPSRDETESRLQPLRAESSRWPLL